MFLFLLHRGSKGSVRVNSQETHRRGPSDASRTPPTIGVDKTRGRGRATVSSSPGNPHTLPSSLQIPVSVKCTQVTQLRMYLEWNLGIFSRKDINLPSSSQRQWGFYRVGVTTGTCPTHHYCVRDEHTRPNLGLNINAASWERQEAARLR